MKLFKDKKGVSPVIGVILMVAITVILAAVIASFVFGMGSKVKSAPQAQFMLEDASDQVDASPNDLFVVTDFGGEPVKCSEIMLQVINTTSNTMYTMKWNDSENWFEYKDNNNLTLNTTKISDGVLNVGDSFTVKEVQNLFAHPTTIEFRIIHTPTGTVIYDGRVTIQ